MDNSLEKNTEFKAKQTEKICQLFEKRAKDIAQSKGILIEEAELRLIASMIGPDKFYKTINCAINIQSTADQSATAISYLKELAWAEIKAEYRNTAARQVKEELSKPRTRPEEGGKC